MRQNNQSVPGSIYGLLTSIRGGGVSHKGDYDSYSSCQPLKKGTATRNYRTNIFKKNANPVQRKVVIGVLGYICSFRRFLPHVCPNS